jgi:hypothetical protein
MKNFFRFFNIVALSTVIFYGCGTAKTFNQSRFDDGLDEANNSSDTAVVKSATTENEISKIDDQELVNVDEIASIVSSNEPKASKNKAKLEIVESELVEQTEESKTNTEAFVDPDFSKRSMNKNKDKFRLFNSASLLKNKVKDVKAKLLAHSRGSGDSLSLLWIVIIVLLLLWLFGWGFGLGGLIHVLVVIALILLILWLLRVI